jgi:hypothetical protein
VSQLTHLNRWQRYQVARLEGLIDGLRAEARRLKSRDYIPVIEQLGRAMLDDLMAECEELRQEVKRGAEVPTPEVRFERV